MSWTLVMVPFFSVSDPFAEKLTILLSRLESIRISSRKFENFELFCPLGAMKLGVQQKK